MQSLEPSASTIDLLKMLFRNGEYIFFVMTCKREELVWVLEEKLSERGEGEEWKLLF